MYYLLSSTLELIVKKYAVFIKQNRSNYKMVKYSDESMVTLFMLLGDGLGLEHYIAFLQDENQLDFFGNVTSIKKQGNMVIVTLDENMFPDSIPFITTIDNLVNILNENRRFQRLEVDRIEIVLDNNKLSVTGN